MDLTREPTKSLAILLIQAHEDDWGPGNPGHAESLLKMPISSNTLARKLWEGPGFGPDVTGRVVRLLEQFEAEGFISLDRPTGQEVIVTEVNVGLLKMRGNL